MTQSARRCARGDRGRQSRREPTGTIPNCTGVRRPVKQKTLAAVIVSVILAADLLTKWWALQALSDGRRMELLGGLIPLTLAFNRGAAFGLSIGDDPRWIFIPITVGAVIFLTALILTSGPQQRLRSLASALVLGGALGNLYDRIRWDRGVVDFIGPIDLGFMYWPIFNVADMAITVGAILLAIHFWREDMAENEASPAVEPSLDRSPSG
ncbi:MAG: signal peptidase II [Gemmatimonadales bacterium]|nr:MAG: signal peptidase II [Gemmatimonadales bacterium]